MNLTTNLNKTAETNLQYIEKTLVLSGKKNKIVQQLEKWGFQHDVIHDEYFLNAHDFVRNNLYNQDEINDDSELRYMNFDQIVQIKKKDEIIKEEVWKQIRVIFDFKNTPYIDIFTYNGTIWRFMKSCFQIIKLGQSNYPLDTYEFESVNIFEDHDFSIPRAVLR